MYRQRRMVPNRDPTLQLEFKELAGPDFMKALRRVAGAMDDFEAAWRRELASWPDANTKAACEQAVEHFHERDVVGFARGLRCLADDERLAAAFRAANEIFAALRQGAQDADHHLAACSRSSTRSSSSPPCAPARSTTPELLAELDRVDVLWFPTGGGKTEAYLGLIIMLLFYDRLRGKERGVSAILRFPLRMLSVQQLQRILDVLWFAERLRRELLAANTVVAGGDYSGDEFLLGYWVGRGNSPNTWSTRKRQDEGDHISYWVEPHRQRARRRRRAAHHHPLPQPGVQRRRGQARRRRGRGAPAPPAATAAARRCRSSSPTTSATATCPAVMVCTVDKLAHVARAEQFIGVLAGPTYRCPKHGYFTCHEAWWTRRAEDARAR